MTHALLGGARMVAVACALASAMSTETVGQTSSPVFADLPPQIVALNDLTAFRAPTAGWRVAGGAATLAEGSAAVETSPGTGVLVASAERHAPLMTAWDHGDIDVSFDVMVAQGSPAAVVLMGRYAVRLSDSWSHGSPTAATIGAIAPRWDAARGSGQETFEGTMPRQNAGRAPGLWQSVEIIFRAPRFVNGQKQTNARFVRVSVNGIVVQENVQVPGITQGAAFHDERAAGPLTFDAGRGAVAIRNIRYKSYTAEPQLAGLRYRVYEGDGMSASYAAGHAPSREGVTNAIPADVALPQDKFAVSYEGTFNAPTAGRYRFALNLPWIGNDSSSRGPAIGGGVLRIDDRAVVQHGGVERRTYGDVDLTAGTHAFAVTFYKNRAGFNRRDVSISVEGPGVERRSLTEEIPGFGGPPTDPIMVEPQTEPVVLRSFMRHRNMKRVYVASVADPRGVHYSYDLSQGALLYVWRGPFLETTQMWHERGEDQTAEPTGSALTLPGAPSIARLANAQAAWPDSLTEREFRRDGYQLDKTGRPTFLYHVGEASVEDVMRPDVDGLTLHRELHIRDASGPAASGGLFVQLAQADHIARQRDGSYVIGDRSYYITLPTSREKPVLRHVNGRDELIVPVRFQRDEAVVAYNIVW